MRVQDFDTWYNLNYEELEEEYEGYKYGCDVNELIPQSWDEFISDKYESYVSGWEDYEYDKWKDERMEDEKY